MCYAETLMYSSLNLSSGDSVPLECNTPFSRNVQWTFNSDDGPVDYICRNGEIDSDKPQLSVKPAADGTHSIVISRAQSSDTGKYDCYDDHRKIGYVLIVNGM